MRENPKYRISIKNDRKIRSVRRDNGTSHIFYFENFCFEKIKSYGTFICLSIILSFSLLFFLSKNVQAASGSIYTCKINPTYSHPVTGQVEDAGGSSSSTTGQGMVEGAVGSKGILEVTDSGEYYLTFQLGLMDYSSKQSFGVQNINDSGWNTVSATVTGNGSDSSGKTADMRIPVSSESCIVRCSMYVEPMGRNVIFYFYPSDYTEGNSTSMKTGIVTQNSSSSSGTADTQENSATANNSASSGTSTSNAGTSNGAGLNGTGSSNSSSSSGLASDSSLQNSGTDASSTEDSLRDTQGLSLSTASDADTSENDNSSFTGIVEIIFAVCAGVTISGLLLLFTGAYIVYIFRKNWKRWGAGKLHLTPEEQDYKEENVYMADEFGELDTDDEVWDSEGVVHEEFWTEPGAKLSADSEGALDAKSNEHLNNKEDRFFEECQEKESKKNIWDFEEESSFIKGYDEIGNSAELEGEEKYEN